MKQLYLRLMAAALVVAGLSTSARADLLSYWTFNGDFNDSVGSNHATLIPDVGSFTNNATTGDVDGRVALILDGLGDGLMTPANASLDFGPNSSFTYSFWVRGQENGLEDTTDYRSTLLMRDVGSNPFNGVSVISFGPNHGPNAQTNGFRGTLDGGAPSVSNQVAAADQVLNGTWRHVAWVVSDIGSASGSSTLYLDGAVLNSVNDLSSLVGDSITTSAGSVPLYIGAERANGTRWLFGAMDDLAVWSDALPASSIAGLADGTYTPMTAPVPEPGSMLLAGLGIIGLGLVRRARSAG